MKRQRTWKEYRAIDLTLPGMALAVFEFIIVRAAKLDGSYEDQKHYLLRIHAEEE